MTRKWERILDNAIIILCLVAAFAWHESRANEPTDGRTVLCIGIIANTSNVARDDPFVIDACREAGVDRNDYPPTVK